MQQKLKAKLIGGTAAVQLAVATALPFTAHHEGLRLKAYLDPVGIPTICYGETEKVKLGDTKTLEECNALFETRLGYFAYRVAWLADQPLHPKMHAALTSFTYNIGVEGFKNSTARRKLNEGDYVGACNAIATKIQTASGACSGYGCGWSGGKMWRGLQTRRVEEKNLCLEGAYAMNQGGYDVSAVW